MAAHEARKADLSRLEEPLLVAFLLLSTGSVCAAAAYSVVLGGLPPVRPAQFAFVLLAVAFFILRPAASTMVLPYDRRLDPWVAFLFATMLSALASGAFPFTLADVADDVTALLFVWMLVCVGAASRDFTTLLRRLLIAAMIGGVASALAAIAMFFTRYVPAGVELSTALVIGPFIRQPSVFDDPNYFVSTLLLSIVAASAVVLEPRLRAGRGLRVVAVASVFILTLGVFTTLSRGGILAVGLYFVTLALLSDKVRLPVALLVMAVLGALVAWFLGDALTALFDEKVASADSEDSLLSRIAQMQAGLGMLQDHPLLGVGPGRFAASFLDYQNQYFSYQSDVGWRMHNTYLEVLFEQGIIGIAAFAVLLLSSLATAWRLARGRDVRDTVPRAAMSCVFAGLLAVMALAMTVALAGRLGFVMLLAMPMLITAATERRPLQPAGSAWPVTPSANP
jgi:O-antigen ligase